MSLSKPHISGTTLHTCVYAFLLVATYGKFQMSALYFKKLNVLMHLGSVDNKPGCCKSAASMKKRPGKKMTHTRQMSALCNRRPQQAECMLTDSTNYTHGGWGCFSKGHNKHKQTCIWVPDIHVMACPCLCSHSSCPGWRNGCSLAAFVITYIWCIRTCVLSYALLSFAYPTHVESDKWCCYV